jgi:hypothetical protein
MATKKAMKKNTKGHKKGLKKAKKLERTKPLKQLVPGNSGWAPITLKRGM